MLVLAAILLVGGTAAYVMTPLILKHAAPLADGSDVELQIHELEALKEVAYETLHDVELDYHAGKIDAADYRAMTDKYSLEAAGLLGRIDALKGLLPRPEDPRRDPS